MLFGKKNRSDSEWWSIDNFTRGFCCGSSWYVKYFWDLQQFQELYNIPQNLWQEFYSNHSSSQDLWPVVEKQDNQTVYAWFKNGIRKTEWKIVS